jgi:RimJ/RimL family protein N-acetyltransferase
MRRASDEESAVFFFPRRPVTVPPMLAHLETDRLWLCAWSLSDFEGSRPIFTDPEIMRYISGGVPRSDDQIREFIARQQNHLRQRGFCLWKLLLKPDARLVGFCGLQPLELDGAPEVEIGWRLAKDQWRRGLATEAARVALHHAVEYVHLLRVIAIAMPENSPSLHVMEKLGMTFERPTQKEGFKVVVYSRHFGSNSPGFALDSATRI